MDAQGFSGGGFWDPKSIKNRSENEVGQGRRPGIDFHAMLVNFGSQNGAQNLLKSYLKTDPKKGYPTNAILEAQKSTGGAGTDPGGPPSVWFAALLGRQEHLIFKDEERLHAGNLQTLYRPLHTPFQRTPTRSWAPSGPVRIHRAAELRTRHRAYL